MRFAKFGALITLAAVPLIAAAFWPLYLSKPFGGTDRYTHFHAILGAVWVFLVILQPLLAVSGKFGLHRAFGAVSYLVAPAFVIAGILLSHYRLSAMSEETFGAEAFTHYLPFYASLAFAVSYLLGLYFRRTEEVHGRFMLLTAVPLIDPVFGRLMAFYFPPLPEPWLYQAITFSLATITAAFLVFSYRGDLRSRFALIGFFVFYVALEVGFFTFALTPHWKGIMEAFRSFPIS